MSPTRAEPGSVEAVLASVFREEAGRLTGFLVRLLGDFDVAEELVQDTLLLALERWRRDGIPDRPGAWLTTAPAPGARQAAPGRPLPGEAGAAGGRAGARRGGA